MSCRSLLISMLLIVLSGQAFGKDSPNVVYIMADDLGCTSAERTPVGQIRKVCERDI